MDPTRVSWEARTHSMIINFPDPIRSLDEKNTQNVGKIEILPEDKNATFFSVIHKHV